MTDGLRSVLEETVENWRSHSHKEIKLMEREKENAIHVEKIVITSLNTRIRIIKRRTQRKEMKTKLSWIHQVRVVVQKNETLNTTHGIETGGRYDSDNDFKNMM